MMVALLILRKKLLKNLREIWQNIERADATLVNSVKNNA
jgi:hypothetical protein